MNATKARYYALFALLLLALGATQLSCNVNDYCLNCGTGDGGGTGSDGSVEDAEVDAEVDAGCVPTGPEICDGIDNDCNGLEDDGNVQGENVLCDNQMGFCAGGTTVCNATPGCSSSVSCNPQNPNSNCCMECTKNPSPETCDNVDNNCNGTVDEGNPGGGGKCGVEAGECVAGTEFCQAVAGCNAAANCDNEVPGNNCCVKCVGFIDRRNDPEECNAKDDNCNQQFDEGLTNLGACTWQGATEAGECVIGTLSCVGGNEQCNGAVFPKFETCNGLNDDCDANIDEIFNKNVDPQNCGNCGVMCLPRSKTCVGGTNNRGTCSCTTTMECNTDTECPGGTCQVNSQPCCGPTCGTTNPNGMCNHKCNVGFVDLNGTASDGCEYKCSPTGNEECDGIDNDCDGMIDEPGAGGITPPANLCAQNGVCAGSTASCDGFDGWECNYPIATFEATEVSCDGLNNDCDLNIDESHPNKGQACDDNQPGVCLDAGEEFCNSADPDGALICMSPFETLTECNNNMDDNGNGVINEGCPVVGLVGETGSQCNNSMDEDSDGRFNDGCPPAALSNTPSGTESCNAKDDDCDGSTDEGSTGAGTPLNGQDWVTLANGVQMMKYEASRADALMGDQGISTATVCSRPNVLPWTNITYPQAVLECAAIGARLCTEAEWHHACSVVPTPSALTTAVTTALDPIIEAEDYSSIAFAIDTAANPDVTRAWVHDYTGNFSGISDMEATPNTNGGNVPLANAVAQAPRLSYALNVTEASAAYHVWVKMYQTGLNNSNDLVYARIATATPSTLQNVDLPAPTACTTNATCSFLTGGACVDLANDGLGVGGNDFCAGWQWVDAGTFNLGVGAATLDVFMGDDGVKVDKVAIRDSAVAPTDSDLGSGNTWAYGGGVDPNVASDTTCNGHERVAANDNIVPTGSLAMCFADNASTNDMFDMSGNVKEWTVSQQPGVNPLRGGASNSTTVGTSCPLNFTVADDDLLFPNIGFRCCR